MSVYHYDNARIAKRLVFTVLVVVGVGLMGGLYYVKTQAQTSQKHAQNLAAEIERETVEIGILRAELAHFESPTRVQDLAQYHLGLAPMGIAQVIALEALEDRFPLRDLDQKLEKDES